MKGIIVVASVFCAGLAFADARAQPGVKPQSAIVILGDGTPLLSADRSGTSIGIVVRGTLYVFDAGPGVLRRIHEARERLRLGIQGLGPVFVTHLHSDHTLGIPELFRDSVEVLLLEPQPDLISSGYWARLGFST